MFCLSVCLLLFFFSYGHSKQTSTLLLLDLYYRSVGVQSVTLIIGFIHGQRIFFTNYGLQKKRGRSGQYIEKVGKKKKCARCFPGVPPFRPTYRLYE